MNTENAISYRSVAQLLAPLYKDKAEAVRIALLILAHVTGKTITDVYSNPVVLTEAQHAKLHSILTEHVEQHKPLQYLLGTVPFLDVTIIVEPPCLIPRPETEEWVQWLIQKLTPAIKKDQTYTFLDLCTGTGVIALSLAQAFPQCTVIGIDIAEYAIALANKNKKQLGITNVQFVHSDLFNQLLPDQKCDLIVANPPYIAEAAYQTLEPHIKKWEDPLALRAGVDGLAVIDRIIHSAAAWLKSNSALRIHDIPSLILEIGFDQGVIVKQKMIDAGYTSVSVLQDSSGNDRVVIGTLT